MVLALLPVTLAAFGLAFAVAVRSLRSQRGKRFTTPPPRIVAGPALISGLVAAFVPVHPTAVHAFDNFLAFAIGALAVVVGLRVQRTPLLCALAVLTFCSLLVGGSLPAAIFGGVGLGVAVALRSLPRPSPLFGALATSLSAQAALRLPTGLPSRAPSAIAFLALALLSASAYGGCRPATRTRVRRLAFAVAGTWAAAGVLGVVGLVLARNDAMAGIDGGRATLRLVQDTNRGGSSTALEGAKADLMRLRTHLQAWWMKPAQLVPVMAQHVSAFTQIDRSALRLVQAAQDTTTLADARNIRVDGGGIDVARLRKLQEPSRRLDSALGDLRSHLGGLDDPWLSPLFTDRAAELDRELAKADAATASLRATLAVLPAMLGADGPRRYLLVVPTPAEARGSGGVIGNYGELVADNGQVRLVSFGRVAELRDRGIEPEKRKLLGRADYVSRYAQFQPQAWWQNVTMSPDFPSSAEVMAGLYPQSGGHPVDGVISIDPIGLAALLRLTGPISVPAWPEPITAANAARTLLFDQYVRFPSQNPAERAQLLGTVAAAVWQTVMGVQLPAPSAIGAALGPVASGRHLQVWSKRPDEETYLRSLHADGALGPVDRDGLAVVVNNGSGNKIEWFLHRSIDYAVTIDRRLSRRADLDVTLRNEAPPSGLPRLIIGNDIVPPPPDGTSRLYVSIYSPMDLDNATVDGSPIELERQSELGRQVYSAWLTLPANSKTVLALHLHANAPGGKAAAPQDGGYRLDVAQQPLVWPDDLRVRIDEPSGHSDQTGSARTVREWNVKQDGPLSFAVS